jgi:hypothetical protein
MHKGYLGAGESRDRVLEELAHRVHLGSLGGGGIMSNCSWIEDQAQLEGCGLGRRWQRRG